MISSQQRLLVGISVKSVQTVSTADGFGELEYCRIGLAGANTNYTQQWNRNMC